MLSAANDMQAPRIRKLSQNEKGSEMNLEIDVNGRPPSLELITNQKAQATKLLEDKVPILKDIENTLFGVNIFLYGLTFAVLGLVIISKGTYSPEQIASIYYWYPIASIMVLTFVISLNLTEKFYICALTNSVFVVWFTCMLPLVFYGAWTIACIVTAMGILNSTVLLFSIKSDLLHDSEIINKSIIDLSFFNPDNEPLKDAESLISSFKAPQNIIYRDEVISLKRYLIVAEVKAMKKEYSAFILNLSRKENYKRIYLSSQKNEISS
jgi:hypothetical protein